MSRSILIVLVLSLYPLLGFSPRPPLVDTEMVDPEYRPFKKGEFLRYNIHYGFIDAGEATFTINDTDVYVGGNKHYSIRVTGRSYRSWDYFYKIRDYYYSYIDSATMRPTVYSRNVLEGDFKDKESYFFDYKKNEARGKAMGRDTTIVIPMDLQDLASMLYFARSIKFYKKKVGYNLDINVFFGSSWFGCGARFDGYENITTKLGTFRCMRIIPELVSGRVFKGQQDMVVYVTADENQVPIRIESEIFVGSIKVDLVEYANLSYPLKSKLDD